MRKYDLNWMLKNYMGFSDWVVSEYHIAHDGEVTWFKLGRWHGHKFIESEFAGGFK